MEEKKKNNAATLEQVKKEYQKPCMTQEQVEQMKQRIEEAKAEKQKKAANSYMGRKQPLQQWLSQRLSFCQIHLRMWHMQ